MSVDPWNNPAPGMYERCVGTYLFVVRKQHTSKWTLTCSDGVRVLWTIPYGSMKKAKAAVDKDVETGALA